MLATEEWLCSVESCETDGGRYSAILTWSIAAHSSQPFLYDINQIKLEQISDTKGGGGGLRNGKFRKFYWKLFL
jgi:hypothetical protein